MESAILKTFVSHKYVGNKLLDSGNTELFNIDIFNNVYPTTLNQIKELCDSSTKSN